MNPSIITTINEQLSPPLSLNLAPRMTAELLHEKSSAFLAQLDSCAPLFSLEQLEDIDSWRLEFKQSIEELIADKNREADSVDTALLIGAFLYDFIYPSISGDREKDRALLNMEETLKELLKWAVPQGQSFEQFIAEYEQLMDEEALLHEVRLKIKECFQTQIETLYQFANDSNQKMKESFEGLKRHLIAIVNTRQQKEEESERAFSELNEKVALLQNRLEGLALMAQESGQKSDLQQLEYQKLLIECETMIGGL